MKKYKYYLLALAAAIILTVCQIIITNAASKKDEGFLYIAATDIEKGEMFTSEMAEKIKIYGYSSTFDVRQNVIASENIEKGDVLNNSLFDVEKVADDKSFMCIGLDKNRYPENMIKKNTLVDIIVIPDYKTIGVFEQAWLEAMLKKNDISFNPDMDVAFIIEKIEIDSVVISDYSNRSAVLKVDKSLDTLLAFLKGKCIMEFIIR